MKVKYTRPAQGGFGGASGTESKVEDLPDTDGEGSPTQVPTGAVQVDNAVTAHDWQRNTMGGFPPQGGN